MHHVSFPKNDYYYDKMLDDFYGFRIIEDHSETMKFLGYSGKNFVIDEYRTWLMKILQQEGFSKFEDAFIKYPFLKNNLDKSSSNEISDESKN